MSINAVLQVTNFVDKKYSEKLAAQMFVYIFTATLRVGARRSRIMSTFSKIIVRENENKEKNCRIIQDATS